MPFILKEFLYEGIAYNIRQSNPKKSNVIDLDDINEKSFGDLVKI